MLGGNRVMFVMRAERLLKPKRAAKAEAEAADDADDSSEEEAGALDTVPLEDYLERPSPTTVLVLVAPSRSSAFRS